MYRSTAVLSTEFRIAALESLEPRRLLAVTAGSDPSALVDLNGVLYFSANDSITGFELWKTDGTAGGTVLVKDIIAGPEGSAPFGAAALGNSIYFGLGLADTPQLWRSDGSEAGTVLVKDLTELAEVSQMHDILVMDGVLYFLAHDDQADLSVLFRSDGTANGTTVVKEFDGSFTAQGIIAVGDTLFISAPDPIHGRELWKSDGTEAGTVFVKDINPGTEPSNPGSPLGYFAILDGVLYFPADGPDGVELWKTDGTEAGTQQVLDIDPDGDGDGDPGLLTVVGDIFYFTAEDGTSGRELWKSDGTPVGTVRVRDINPGPGESRPANFAPLGTSLIFQADDGESFNRLFRSDGTEAGTTMIKDIGVSSRNILTWDDTVYFFASDTEVEVPGGHGTELWITDGTDAGTVLVKDINPGALGSIGGGDAHLMVVGDTLFLTVDDGEHGEELWKTDGTEEGTSLVLDISTEDPPFPFTLFGIENGQWQVFGSDRNDLIEVKVVGDRLQATRNGKTESIELSRVSFVNIAGNGGDDRILALTLSIPTSITGDAGNDTIYSGSGNDTLWGGDGNDRIIAGGGGDWVRAGRGDDFVYGETGYDTMWGGEGNDLINGGDGKDRLSGEGGKDQIYGGRNNDQLDGGPLHDRLFGEDGDDILFGHDGSDTIDAGLGADYVDAGRDHDLILAMDSTRDTILAGGGRDRGQVDRRRDLIRGLEILLEN